MLASCTWKGCHPTLGLDTISADGRSFEVDEAYCEQQASDYMIRAVVDGKLRHKQMFWLLNIRQGGK
jgi:hypothetical protein